MRALNEGDISVSTVVRANDHALTRIDASGPRVTLGAGVTFAQILAERDLAFLHAPARSIGGPAVRNMGTVGRQSVRAKSLWRLHGGPACARCHCRRAGRLWHRATSPSKSSCSRARGRPARWCSRCPAHDRRARTLSATARSPVSSRRAAQSSRSQPICRSVADGSPGHGSRWARWRRPKSGARAERASRDARWMPRPSRRRCA